MKDKRVLCHACKKPIKLEKLGMVIQRPKEEQKWYHNNFVCLITYVEEQKAYENNK